MAITDKLTDARIRALKAGSPKRKHADGGGLYILIGPDGSLGWRFKYRVDGREKLISFGRYPEVSLAEARERRNDARKLLRQGVDPSAQRKAARRSAAESFAQIADQYLATQSDLAPRTLDKARWQLREYVNPVIGNWPINTVTPKDLLSVIRRIEARGKIETAHKTKELCGRIFRFGVASGLCDSDVAADLGGALRPRPSAHLAAITEPRAVGELLRAIDLYQGQPATRAALRLLPHIFLRSSELRFGTWAEIDFDAALWRIPAGRMKSKREHTVPLSAQSLAILRDLETVTAGGELMFPAIGPKRRPISENTLGNALRLIGYSSDQHVPHGFRTTASTLLHELGFDSRDIELQLAHADTNKIRGIYNRSERIKERAAMMQAWSDYLDTLRDDKSNVIAIRAKK